MKMMEIGNEGENLMRREIENGDNEVIGIGNGRKIQEEVVYMKSVMENDMSLVQMMGGIKRNFEEKKNEVMKRIEEKKGMKDYMMKVKLLENKEEEREVMMEKRGVKKVLEMG